MIVLLEEGLKWLSGASVSWGGGDMLKIKGNLDGSYTVINAGNMKDLSMVSKGEITIDFPIPINSAVFW